MLISLEDENCKLRCSSIPEEALVLKVRRILYVIRISTELAKTSPIKSQTKTKADHVHRSAETPAVIKNM